MSRTHTRMIDGPEVTVGKTRRKFLSRGNVVAGYVLAIAYDYAMTGGTGAGAVRADAAFRLIDELELKVPGREGPRSLVAVRGHTLAVIDELFNPAPALQVVPTSVAAAAAEADRESILPIPTTILRSFQPEEFALPTAASKVEMVVKMAEAAEAFTTAIDGTPAFSNVEAQLQEVRYEGPQIRPDRMFGAHVINHYAIPVLATGPKTIHLEGLQGYEIARIIVEGMSGGASGSGYTHDDDVITSAALEINGQDVIETTPRSLLQSQNAADYGLSSRKTGVVVFDAARDQRTTAGELWSVIGPDDPEVNLQVVPGAGDSLAVVTVMSVRRPTPRG